MTLVSLQPAFVLHYRPYRDTSLLIDLFTLEHGRVGIVARGARGPRSRIKGLMQPFVPLLVSWTGKTELLSLRNVEPNGESKYLSGQALLSGLYLNELLIRLLQRHDAYPNLFNVYAITLNSLQHPELHQQALRLFEKHFLNDLGYALQLRNDINSNATIDPNQYYFYDPERGPTLCLNRQLFTKPNIFSGKSLLDLAENNFTDPGSLRDAKRLMRLAFAALLGKKPLKSRELFIV